MYICVWVCVHLKEIPIDSGGKSLVKPQKLLSCTATQPGSWWERWGELSWLGYESIPISTIFRGMNIHLPAILMFTRGTRFWPTATSLVMNTGDWIIMMINWIEFDSHEVHEDWLILKIMEYNIVTRNGDWLTGAKRTEWMGMGVAGIMKLIVLVDHSLIPYV